MQVSIEESESHFDRSMVRGADRDRLVLHTIPDVNERVQTRVDSMASVFGRHLFVHTYFTDWNSIPLVLLLDSRLARS